MLTIKCCITFADSQILWGIMRAKSAGGKFSIEYSGASDRLPQMPKSATPAAFELLFSTAIYEGATGFGVNADGQYDFGQKYVPNERLLAVQRNRHLYQKN